MHMVGDSVKKKTNPGCANKGVEHPRKSSVLITSFGRSFQ